MTKDMKVLRRVAEQYGWTVERTNGSHYKWRPPDRRQPIVYSDSTPSDRRGIWNLRAELRSRGLPV